MEEAVTIKRDDLERQNYTLPVQPVMSVGKREWVWENLSVAMVVVRGTTTTSPFALPMTSVAGP